MAVRVNASGEYLRRTANLPSSTAFTACGWAKLTLRTGNYQYWGLEDAASNSTAYLLIGYQSNGTFEISGSSGSGAFASAPTDEKWFFWAITCSGSGAGAFKGYWRHYDASTWVTASATGASFTPAALTLGNDSYDEWLNICFDNTMVFDAALTQAQLEEIMFFAFPERLESINIWSPHFPGATERLADFSGNGRNWTANGTLSDEDGAPLIWDGYVDRPTFPAAGGTTYNQSVSGTLTTAGALTKQTNKPLTGTLSPTGSLIKQVAFHLIGTLSSAGTLLKRTNKPLSGTLTTAGGLVNQTKKSLAGTLSSAGALLKRTSKLTDGTLTLSGALTKQTNKPLSGTLTSSGSLLGRLTKLISLGGTLSMSGTLTKQTGKALGGTLTTAGALRMRTSKLLSGVLTMAGNITKQTRTSLSGTLTMTGALGTVKTFLKSLSATLSMSGSLSKQTNKSTAGTLTSSGTLTKRIAKSLDGTVSFTGNITRQIRKGLSGILTFIGTLVKNASGAASIPTPASRSYAVNSEDRWLAIDFEDRGVAILYEDRDYAIQS